ncbi:MAG: hypothetical protein QW578_01445 [Thermoplasmatales archaeon]
MNNEAKNRKLYTISLRPEEYNRIKQKAEKFGLPLSRLLVLGSLNWDGKIKNE